MGNHKKFANKNLLFWIDYIYVCMYIAIHIECLYSCILKHNLKENQLTLI